MTITVGPIQFFVSDIKKAKKWYSRVLKMKVVKEYPKFNCVLMKLGQIEFDIGVPSPKWGKGFKNDLITFHQRTKD